VGLLACILSEKSCPKFQFLLFNRLDLANHKACIERGGVPSSTS
jgi:hypothetical protein